jgi:hypothetical protein
MVVAPFSTSSSARVRDPIGGPTYCGLGVSLAAVALGGAEADGLGAFDEPHAAMHTSTPVVAATL